MGFAIPFFLQFLNNLEITTLSVCRIFKTPIFEFPFELLLSVLHFLDVTLEIIT